VDEVIAEPLGGAHRNHEEAAQTLKTTLLKHLDTLAPLSREQLIQQRFEKFRAVGKFAIEDPVSVRS
jgi:acetyl-CoA carboxylase carboxyl transferase subunit alpha